MAVGIPHTVLIRLFWRDSKTIDLCPNILKPRLTTVVVPILPPLLSKQGVSDNAVFMLFASKALVQILFNPMIGAMIDKRGPLRPVLWSLAVLAASTLSFALALVAYTAGHLGGWPLYTALLLSRGVQGVASWAPEFGGRNDFPPPEKHELILSLFKWGVQTQYRFNQKPNTPVLTRPISNP